MSRYHLHSGPSLKVLGWDNGLQTFFVQVWEDSENDEDPMLWLGTSFGEIETVEDLNAACKDYGGVPDYLWDTLRKEADARSEVTDLQKLVRQLIQGAGR